MTVKNNIKYTPRQCPALKVKGSIKYAPRQYPALKVKGSIKHPLDSAQH